MTATISRLLALSAALGLAACDRAPDRPAPVQTTAQTVGPIYIPPAAQNISGVWWIRSYSPTMPLAEGGTLPFTPEGMKRYAANRAGLKDGSLKDEARRICLPDGVPRILGNPYPFQVMQTPGFVTIAYELNHVLRTIPLDEKLPSEDELEILPVFSGHSVAHWEGDTLVIESGGFNDATFIDATGAPHTGAMRTLERVRKTGPDTLEWTVTVTDPEIYAQPWTARFVYGLHPEVRLEDYNCGDPHRDIARIPGVVPPG